MSLANKWIRKKSSDFMKISQPLNLYEMALAAAVTCTSFGTWKFRTFQNFGKYTRPREYREEHRFQWVSKELTGTQKSDLEVYCSNIQPKLKKLIRSTKDQSFLMASGGSFKFTQYWLYVCIKSTDLFVKIFFLDFFDTLGTPVGAQLSHGWNQPKNS